MSVINEEKFTNAPKVQFLLHKVDMLGYAVIIDSL